MSDAAIHIRPARAADAAWIIPLAPRMHAFGPPPWREAGEMDAAVAQQWAHELAHPTPGSSFLVAEDASGAPAGFVWVKTERDYFIERPVGHVIDIAVTEAAEGRGVGRALLEAAERWAEERGYPWLTLHVFEGNDRARRLYEKMGYQPEWTRMLKRVGSRLADDPQR
jgi:ribosomal protein S18 acetylase RimI-like enzyme